MWQAIRFTTLLIVAAPAFAVDSGDGEGVPDRMPPLHVEITGGTVDLEARDVPLVEVLNRLAEDLSFRLHVTGRMDERVTLSVDNSAPGEIVERLLDGYSYVTVYDRPDTAAGDAAIRELHVVGVEGRERAAPPEPQSRQERLEHIEQLSREQTVSASRELTGLLHDPDIRIRRAAVRALGEYADFQPLRVALQDSNYWVRKEALRSLGKIGDPRSIDTIEFIHDTDPDERVRELAGRILESLGREARR